MREYTVSFKGRHQVPDIDAQAVYLRVDCNDQYFQYVAIVVSGPDLHDRWGITADHERFWPAVATVGLRTVRTAIQHGAIPTGTPEVAWTHYVNRSDVDRVIRSSAELPVLVDEARLARFAL